MDGVLVKGWAEFNSSLNLPLLAACTPPGWERAFCLEYFNEIDYDIDASIVFLTSMSYDIEHTLEIARAFKARGRRVVFGNHQDRLSEVLLRRECDAVFHGVPNPKAIERILCDHAAGRLEPVYECGVDLNFPFDYSVFGDLKLPHVPVLASVGCRHRCDYCCHTLAHDGRYRLRPLRHVLSDLRQVRRLSRVAAFKDANIYNNRGYLLRLCAALRAERLGLIWGAQSTADIGDDPEALSLLRRAGCRMLFVGFESLDQESLDSIGKPFRASDYLRWAQAIRAAGIHVAGYFMLGLDADTEGTFDAIFQFVREARLALPCITVLIPIPGTPLFERMCAESRVTVPDAGDFLTASPRYSVPCSRAYFTPVRLDSDSLETGFRELAHRLTSWREILRRSLGPSLTESWQVLKMNLALRREHARLA